MYLRTLSYLVTPADVDYHHGNGTMGIFWEDANVLFASLHMHPDYDYPYCTGYEDETGPASGPAANTTITVPLMPGTVWSSYKTKLQHVLDRVAAFGAQAVVVSMGFDTLGGDREASDGAGMNLAPADFTEMGRMFTCLPIPVLYIQEGGYYLEVRGSGLVSQSHADAMRSLYGCCRALRRRLHT
jgi:acetoin utilization deacetylase AcuC-like enzyme